MHSFEKRYWIPACLAVTVLHFCRQIEQPLGPEIQSLQ